ncbi:hypothetical protein [Anaerovorax odorimutans]|nr:hypothetical protein [Anaerovorax odorimutans]
MKNREAEKTYFNIFDKVEFENIIKLGIISQLYFDEVLTYQQYSKLLEK